MTQQRVSMKPPFHAVYELLLQKGPARAISTRGTEYRIEARRGKIVAFPGSGRITIHEDCWGENTTCHGTRAGGIYNGAYSIFQWFSEHQFVDGGKVAQLDHESSETIPGNVFGFSPLLHARPRQLKTRGSISATGGLLDDNASRHITAYDRRCLHYNLIAEGVYGARTRIGNPLSPDFEPYIVAGLLGFDMGRTMGKGDVYSLESGFAGRLRNCTERLRTALGEVSAVGALHQADIGKISPLIVHIYSSIAAKGALSKGKNFDVGATKILHWMFPDLFIMVDSNVAKAFNRYMAVAFVSATQKRYSAEKYVECLRCAQAEIQRYGSSRFLALEQNRVPVARTFDKIAFVRGASIR
jgi:hypothetical protein